jgi:hypothetical protein
MPTQAWAWHAANQLRRRGRVIFAVVRPGTAGNDDQPFFFWPSSRPWLILISQCFNLL